MSSCASLSLSLLCRAARPASGCGAPTTSAGRSRRSGSSLEGRETTEPLLTQVVETRRRASRCRCRRCARAVAHLFSLGRFEDVSVDATLENGGVALRYELIPIHPVARIRFDGPLDVPGVDGGALRRAIVDRYGVSPPLGRAADMTRISGRRAARARLPARRR